MAILKKVTPTVIFGQFEWDKLKEYEVEPSMGLISMPRSGCSVWVVLEEEFPPFDLPVEGNESEL